MRRVLPAVTALAVAAVLPVVASPAQAAAPGSTAEQPVQRSDVRRDALATERSTERQNAVDELVTGGAKLRGTGADRVIRLTDGTEVNYPTNETAQLLTFLVDFGDGTENPAYPDQTAGPANNEIPAPGPNDNSTYWKSAFNTEHYLDMFFNGMDEQDGESFKGLYKEMSSGRFDLQGDVSDWVTVPHPEAYYNDADGVEGQPEMTAFIGDSATAWYDAQVDAGKSDAEIKQYLQAYDQWDRYDYDQDGVVNEPDGYIDHFQAIHAGEGEEAQAPNEDTWMIWSHRWAANQGGFGVDGPSCSGCYKLGGVQIGNTGYWIRDYTTEPENGGLGVFAHEFGHDLGLPDFYDTDQDRIDDNGAGFWTLMSSGSWLSQEGAASGTTPNHMGPAEKLFLGWYGANDLAVVDGLSDEPVEVTLGPSTRATTKGDQVVAVDLPDGLRPADGPAVGSTDDDYLYSGDRADYAATAAAPAPIAIPAGDSTLTARVAYDIESGYDYAYLQVFSAGAWQNVETSLSTATNPHGQNLGHGITGDTGGHGATWQTLTADLSAYAGGQVQLRWKYVTDEETTDTGLMVDDLEIGGYSTAFEPASGWVLGGFHLVEDGGYEAAYSRYYLAENRQYRDYDTTLESGPYSANYADFNQLDHFAYQDGLLIWYADGRYTDNDTSVHPGGGMALPVDANPANQLWEPESGPGVLTRSRLQSFDSTFDVDETDALEMTRGDQTLSVPAHPSVPVFEDADPEAYLDQSGGPGGLWYSTGVSGLGSEIQVLSSNETTGVMKLKVGQRFVAATSEPGIAGAHAVGETLTATPPSWFQDDVTTEVAWLRDGQPIGDADDETYEITPADVDHTISASFTGSKPDYTDTTVETDGIELVADPAPEPLGQPSITGTTEVGKELVAHTAGWPVTGESKFTWTVGGEPRGVGGDYTIRPEDLGQAVRLTETFTSDGREDATVTVDSAVVTKGTAQALWKPQSFLNVAQVGQALAASKATWTVDGVSTYVWTVDGAQVGTGPLYMLTPADLGKRITATETFTSPGYHVATNALTSPAVIPGAAPLATTAPRISGTIRVGSTLEAVPGTWPVAGASTLAWSVAGQTVGTGTTYVVKAADAGKPLRLIETLSIPGYDNGTASTVSENVGRSPVTLSVTIGKAKKGKRVSVTVTAKSDRLAAPGKVTLTYAGKPVGSPTLKNGKVTVKLRARPKGQYRLKISYAGNGVYGKAGKLVTVKVK